jgi:hypothetical protein
VLGAEKVNLASLGNQVPHLHWHVIPRFKDDPHFPFAIWGRKMRWWVLGARLRATCAGRSTSCSREARVMRASLDWSRLVQVGLLGRRLAHVRSGCARGLYGRENRRTCYHGPARSVSRGLGGATGRA